MTGRLICSTGNFHSSLETLVADRFCRPCLELQEFGCSFFLNVLECYCRSRSSCYSPYHPPYCLSLQKYGLLLMIWVMLASFGQFNFCVCNGSSSPCNVMQLSRFKQQTDAEHTLLPLTLEVCEDSLGIK